MQYLLGFLTILTSPERVFVISPCVIKYSTQIVEAQRDGHGADGFGVGDGDNEGVSGGRGDNGCSSKEFGGINIKGVVRGVRRGGPGMNRNSLSASCRSSKACLENEGWVNEVLLHLEGVVDIEVWRGSGRLWWCRRGGPPARGLLAVETLPGGNPGSMCYDLVGKVP
jgi:hypothetical protein